MTTVPFESKDWEAAYDRMKVQRDELEIKLQNMCGLNRKDLEIYQKEQAIVVDERDRYFDLLDSCKILLRAQLEQNPAANYDFGHWILNARAVTDEIERLVPAAKGAGIKASPKQRLMRQLRNMRKSILLVNLETWSTM